MVVLGTPLKHCKVKGYHEFKSAGTNSPFLPSASLGTAPLRRDADPTHTPVATKSRNASMDANCLQMPAGVRLIADSAAMGIPAGEGSCPFTSPCHGVTEDGSETLESPNLPTGSGRGCLSSRQ